MHVSRLAQDVGVSTVQQHSFVGDIEIFESKARHTKLISLTHEGELLLISKQDFVSVFQESTFMVHFQHQIAQKKQIIQAQYARHTQQRQSSISIFQNSANLLEKTQSTDQPTQTRNIQDLFGETITTNMSILNNKNSAQSVTPLKKPSLRLDLSDSLKQVRSGVQDQAKSEESVDS